MPQAITTKYLSPTNTRPGRIKAIAQAGSVVVDWDHSLNVENNLLEALGAFLAKFNWLAEAGNFWRGKWHCGDDYKGNTVWVFTQEEE